MVLNWMSGRHGGGRRAAQAEILGLTRHHLDGSVASQWDV